MNWHYAEGGQPKGPISEAELDALFKAGTIDASTLVWREGMENWQPYGQVKGPGAVPPAMAPAGGLVCAQCGRGFPADQVISFGQVWVCAGCKPLFVQRLREGATLGGRGQAGKRPLPVNADELIREIQQRGYEVDIGGCIQRGWEVVKANLGLAVGATVLVTLCTQAGGIIPFIGVLIAMVINGPLMGGLNWFFLRLVRGEPATLGDAFAGFSYRFGRLLGAFWLISIAAYIWMAPGFIGLMITNGDEPVFIVLMLAGILPAIYVGVASIFTLPLIMDMELGITDAFRVSIKLVSMHWWSMLLFLVVGGLVMLVGLLACCVGVLVSAPVFYAALMQLYEHIFGWREST